MANLKLFISLLFACFLIDMTWLGLIAKKLYADSLGGLLRKTGEALTPNWPAAILVYIAIVAGVIFFVLPKANGNYLLALMWGGLFGAVTYGIYDFTNLAILANWPVKISIIDFIWGTLLCAMVTIIGVFLQQKLT
jgi:uncharacterized membrane protein